VERVQSADIAVILVTPASTQKPWVLWEAGAVYGAGLASANAEARKVRPLLFKLSGDEVPAPFAGIQGVNGDEYSGIERFLRDLIDSFEHLISKRQFLKAGEVLHRTIQAYLDRVQRALRDAPLLPTEAAIQEWCERLDKLAADNRLSEVGHVHDWLNLTFGRGRDERPLPLDLRLHRRLGDAYRAAKNPVRASEQFRLALELAPRDIFLLRALGLACLDGQSYEEAARIVNRISELDENAFTHNVECAALKGRLQREQNDIEGAVETYRRALACNPNSYYIADVLGQTLLRLGRLEEAQHIFCQAGEIIDGLAEQNVWTHATKVTVSLVMEDEPRALRHLAAIAALKPAPDQTDRIEAGLERIHEALHLDADAFRRWRVALKGEG
jgi:tetratricopeptide (TPR) repeat protein